MIRSTLLLVAISSGVFIAACSKDTPSNKDTISQTTRPPDPAPGATLVAANRVKKPRPVGETSGTPEATAPQPADENSEFSIKMNEDGSISEFRTFRDHPQIAKAEVHWTHPIDKVLKLELKGGRVLRATVPEDFNLRRVTSADLLTAGKSAASDPKADRPRVVKGK
jgi:hypothetical protein